MNEETDYEDLIAIVETAHGIRLTHEQIDRLNARLDDEHEFFPPISFERALRIAMGYEDGPKIDIRAHVLAVAAELDD